MYTGRVVTLFRTTLTILATASLLSACSTAEYRQTYDQCALQGYDRYPTQIETFIEECSREVEVDSGKTECITTYEPNSERTVCGPLMETVTQTYECEAQRDTNKSARDIFARQCAEQACIAQYGNAECSVEK